MTTAATPETTVELDPKVPLVRITREFDAPPAKVFRAHAEADLMAQWLAPHGYTLEVHAFDFRDGGEYRFSHGTPEGAMEFRGCFHEVRPAELIVQTFTMLHEPDGVALEKIVFEDIGDGRTRLVSTSLVDSFEDRDAFVASGFEEGIVECFAKLDVLLAEDP